VRVSRQTSPAHASPAAGFLDADAPIARYAGTIP
jgi:hypothetical protein